MSSASSAFDDGEAADASSSPSSPKAAAAAALLEKRFDDERGSAGVDGDVVDDWEQLLDSSSSEDDTSSSSSKAKNSGASVPQLNAEPKSVKPASSSSSSAAAKGEAGGGASVDALAEKLQRQKLVEEEDQKLAADLFEGCDRPEGHQSTSARRPAATSASRSSPSAAASSASKLRGGGGSMTVEAAVEALPLKTLSDCERVANLLSDKICLSPAKSVAWMRFLTILLKECAPKMEAKDLTTIRNKAGEAIVAKQRAQTNTALNKRKPNDTGKLMKGYREEMDIFYGDMSDDQDDGGNSNEEGDDANDDFYNDFM